MFRMFESLLLAERRRAAAGNLQIKTNMFVSQSGAGLLDCTADIVRRQGVRGLFKGFGANWARQGPMTTAVFVVSEAIRPVLGLPSL